MNVKLKKLTMQQLAKDTDLTVGRIRYMISTGAIPAPDKYILGLKRPVYTDETFTNIVKVIKKSEV